MNSVAHEVDSFKGLVQGLLQVLAGELSEKLASVLAATDEALAREVREAGWESIGKRERVLVTLFGVEVRIRRRGYRRRLPDGNDTYRWPLDEVLGLRPQDRFCPLTQEIAVNLAAQVSFRSAADFLQTYLRVPVSHQEVHRWTQWAGEDREEEQREAVAAAMEHGVVANGTTGAAAVYLEADGVYLPLQRERADWVEAKLGVLHEGWEPESPAQKRFRLKAKAAWGGVLPAEAFWERGAVRYHERYDPDRVRRTLLNGDGADWIKTGKQHFAGVEYYLDRYHLQEALRRGLGFAPDLLQAAQQAIRSCDWQALRRAVADALGRAPGDEHVQRVKELRRYLESNREGLFDWRSRGDVPPDARGLGAAEGQVNHIVAARMTKRGMSWRTGGVHRMVQLRLLGAESRLSEWLQGWQRRRWPEVTRADGRHSPQRIIEQLDRTEPGAWLQVSLPILATGAARTPLGRVLKRLAHDTSLWNIRSKGQPVAFGANIFAPKIANS